MTTKPTNRLDRLEAVRTARQWGEQAAMFNESWASNPYEKPGYLWSIWAEAFQRTIERLAEQKEKSQ